jgi:beta-N-acetylhexosaminidase
MPSEARPHRLTPPPMRKFTRVSNRISVCFLAISVTIALSSWPAAEPLPTSTRDSLIRHAGQLLVLGFSGTNSSSPGFRNAISDLERGVIGGVLFLPENITSRSELETMVREVKHCACSAIPLIAIDEEGGTVERLGEEFGFPHIQSAAEIGSGSEENAKFQYKMLAQKLFDIGFNINFAPVVDLNKNPNNPIIGARGRSFSRDPLVVAKFAKIFIAAHHALGILTTLKHFPGHGSSSTDTHLTATDVGPTWSEDELIPYQRLLTAGMVDAIMVGHLINERKWGGVATQEGSTAISRLLRRHIDFNGVVISDDLTMDAVSPDKNNFPAVLDSSLNAGINIVLVAHPVATKQDEGQYLNSALVDAAIAKKIPLRLIEASWRRVTMLKAKLTKNGSPILPQN